MRYLSSSIWKRLYRLILPLLFPFLMAMGTHNPAPPPPMSIQELYEFCGFPVTCDQPVSWEGRTVSIQGTVDPLNIFDKKRYPKLPYEKFSLTDGQHHSIEVWPQANDNGPIFDKLARRPRDAIVITGQLAAVKLPTMNRCMWGVKVLIHDPSHIEF